jgi:hypothetical protein
MILLLALCACAAAPGATSPTTTTIPTATDIPTAEATATTIPTVTPMAIMPPPARTEAPTGGANARRPSLGEPFSIGVGETIFVDVPDQQGNTPALQIRFDSVLSDSRCPRLVECVVAGDAALAVVAQLPGRQPEALEVHMNPYERRSHANAYGMYLVQIVQLEPIRDRPDDAPLDPGKYRAQLIVTRGDGPSPIPQPIATVQTGPPAQLDACSLLEQDQVLTMFGPLQGTPQPDNTATGNGQQCVIAAERATLTISLYLGDMARAREIVAELRQSGAPLTEVDESPINLEVFGQDAEQAAMVRQFGDSIVVATLAFGAQIQQADRDRAHERLGTIVSIALVRYASGNTTERTTP